MSTIPRPIKVQFVDPRQADRDRFIRIEIQGPSLTTVEHLSPAEAEDLYLKLAFALDL